MQDTQGYAQGNTDATELRKGQPGSAEDLGLPNARILLLEEGRFLSTSTENDCRGATSAPGQRSTDATARGRYSTDAQVTWLGHVVCQSHGACMLRACCNMRLEATNCLPNWLSPRRWTGPRSTHPGSAQMTAHRTLLRMQP